MRQIFNDEKLNSSFIEQGYVVVDLLTAGQLAILQELYEQEQFPPTGDFYLTIWKDEPAHRLMIHQKVQQIISSSYQHILNNYKPVITSFAVKKSGQDSAWHPHQDDTFVDEKQFVSLSIWIPLIATNGSNGTLRVLPGSHRQYSGPRSPNIPQPFKDRMDDIAAALIDIDLKPCQAVVFDHRLVHGSRQNNSDRPRVAAVSVFIPEEADLTYLYLDKSSNPHMIKQYAISERYYLEAPLGEYSIEPGPDKYRLVATYPYTETDLN